MFAKRPVPGRTKTRLAAAIGDAAAAELAEAFLLDLLSRCQHLADRFSLLVTPDDAECREYFSGKLKPESQLGFQPNGDLGQRMEWFFESAFPTQATRVVLIGSDSPDLPDEWIHSAFDQLKTTDVVLVPATDGGFVLVGLRRPIPGLFHDVSWSSYRTLSQTIAAAERARATVSLLPPWYDVDTLENLGTLLALQETGHSGAASCPATLRRIRADWEEWGQNRDL
ncbi:MAG: TIGR04282 family arsenosugar biosynthesis glycosyltransferase [Planctomycetaceae bacterium]